MPKRKPLAESFPDLAKEAHGWDPTQIHDLTNVKMEWVCKKGHTWLAFTYTRTGKNPKGCPVCANKSVAVGSNDLKSQFPELALEADGWDPETVSIGTHKKYSWRCKKGHSWLASVANRVKGTGCPYCANNKLLIGFNDLKSVHPEIAAEADGWDPSKVLSGAAKKLKWKCSRGHSWQATVSSRTGKAKTGCPYCWGRFVIEGETDLATLFPDISAEAHGWDPKKVNSGSRSKAEFKCSKGHIYRTQIASRTSLGVGCSVCGNKVIVPGVNDLATTHPELALEADGWDPTKVVAGSNKNFDWKCGIGHQWTATVNHRTGRNQGCPFCTGFRVLVGENDLGTTNPDIASEADGWNPKDYFAGSNIKVSWKCSLGHRWETAISHRTGKLKTGCPVCANYKVEPGFNDLGTKFPELSLEADGWDPTTVGAGTNQKLAWRCKLGHKWKANVSSRTGKMKTGCPVCANLLVQTGFNDLATTHPEIAREAFGWDPKVVAFGSTFKLEWKCSNGHIYLAPPIRRTSRNTGCSICANKVLFVGFNDLATTHPELAKEAFGWDPKEVNAGRGLQKSGKVNQKRKWKCSLGHIWEATPSSRTNTHHQSGCPVCSGNQLLVGFNDLATTHPDLALEAIGWEPTQFVSSGKKKFKWKCSEGHVWGQTIQERKSGSGCPSCAQSGFDPNKDGWLYFLAHPDWEMLQIGITNVPDDRLAIHKRLGWEVLELRGPMVGDLARQWETDILRMLRKKGAVVGSKEIAGKFTGYTESWMKNSYPIESLKELMNLVQDNE